MVKPEVRIVQEGTPAPENRAGAREEEACGSHDLISPAGRRSRRLGRAGRR